MQKMREKKDYDFGKESLTSMLSGSQNMLARSAGDKGDKLLARAVAEIDNTPFLETAEKQQYRDDYLKTGILNLALNDPDKASAMTDKYMPAFRDELKKRIDDTRALKEAFDKQEKERQQREADIAEYRQAFSYWQAKEEGNINPAEFYVLTAENKPETLWGERENRSDTPLADAYRIVKKINSGSQLSAEELRNAGNHLISAYRQKKLGLSEVGELQNQLMLAEGDKAFSGLLFDKEVDALADRVFMPDAEGTDAADFMEEKSQARVFRFMKTITAKKRRWPMSLPSRAA